MWKKTMGFPYENDLSKYRGSGFVISPSSSWKPPGFQGMRINMAPRLENARIPSIPDVFGVGKCG